MIWTLIGILILLWILGFAFQIGGGLIHALLVIALIVFIVQLITGRRRL
ncbi:lmo0937 family membrane protein [Sphingosinicella sp. BN140058]|nr:lmo0937 family membrane protein [Sphingosinicella sp. BN140058]QAY79035.1 lmo0937 family membrane protein [Sphingosinicella sp. BN140058]